jgi:hypothetical protein
VDLCRALRDGEGSDRVSRHRRLQKTLRSPQRLTRQSRNRFGRAIGRRLREYFLEDFACDEKRGKR